MFRFSSPVLLSLMTPSIWLEVWLFHSRSPYCNNIIHHTQDWTKGCVHFFNIIDKLDLVNYRDLNRRTMLRHGYCGAESAHSTVLAINHWLWFFLKVRWHTTAGVGHVHGRAVGGGKKQSSRTGRRRNKTNWSGNNYISGHNS